MHAPLLSRVCLSVLLTACVAASWSASPAQWPLQEALGTDAKLHQSPRSSTVEYCPDNTCDSFEAKGADSLALLHDFAYLYLYAHGQYLYLAEFKATTGAPYVSAVASRYASSCPVTSSSGTVECVLKLLQGRLGITYAFVRYDEGHRCVVPESLLGVASTAKPKCTKVSGAS
jgi:hypothetical protein